jgi:hypothetical protein
MRLFWALFALGLTGCASPQPIRPAALDYTETNQGRTVSHDGKISVTVIGEGISQTGAFELAEGATVDDLLFRAGPMSPYAMRHHITVTRTLQDGRQVKILWRSDHTGAPLLLQSGDILNVPVEHP